MTRKAVFHDGGAFDDGAPLNIGAKIKVTDGSSTVDPATTVAFTGASVASPGGGTASVTVSGGTASVSFGTPAPTWSTVDAIGSSGKALQSDAEFALFTAGLPSTQAFSDSASAGTVAFPARLDHKHAMPASPAVTYGTPAPTWSTVDAIGSSGKALQSDATFALFDGAVSSTQAFGDAATAGTVDFAARRDHKHAMPAAFDLAATIHAATGKTTPVDADELALVDSAASNVLKKLTWANLKATLKTYFDTLYASGAGSGTDTRSEGSSTSGTPGTAVASITAGASKQFIALNVLAAQSNTANTQLTLTITFSDTTTITTTTAAANAEQVFANNAGYLKCRGGAFLAQDTAAAKKVTAVAVITAGTGTGTRAASISALEVPI